MKYSHHLISSKGSDRATAYVSANRAVTLRDKTYVVWTDAVAFTRGRVFDHATRKWGPTFTFGEGCDNHNNPSLTADRKGRLHVVYGPHGHWDQMHRMCEWPSGQYKYSVSTEPHSLSGLDKAQDPFGYSATYASMIHTAADIDCIVYRGGEQPPAVMFQKQRKEGGWTQARPIFEQLIAPQYTHYLPTLAAGPDGVSQGEK